MCVPGMFLQRSWVARQCQIRENHVSVGGFWGGFFVYFFPLSASCCFLAMYFGLPSIYLADERFRECLGPSQDLPKPN